MHLSMRSREPDELPATRHGGFPERHPTWNPIQTPLDRISRRRPARLRSNPLRDVVEVGVVMDGTAAEANDPRRDFGDLGRR